MVNAGLFLWWYSPAPSAGGVGVGLSQVLSEELLKVSLAVEITTHTVLKCYINTCSCSMVCVCSVFRSLSSRSRSTSFKFAIVINLFGEKYAQSALQNKNVEL